MAISISNRSTQPASIRTDQVKAAPKAQPPATGPLVGKAGLAAAKQEIDAAITDGMMKPVHILHTMERAGSLTMSQRKELAGYLSDKLSPSARFGMQDRLACFVDPNGWARGKLAALSSSPQAADPAAVRQVLGAMPKSMTRAEKVSIADHFQTEFEKANKKPLPQGLRAELFRFVGPDLSRELTRKIDFLGKAGVISDPATVRALLKEYSMALSGDEKKAVAKHFAEAHQQSTGSPPGTSFNSVLSEFLTGK